MKDTQTPKAQFEILANDTLRLSLSGDLCVKTLENFSSNLKKASRVIKDQHFEHCEIIDQGIGKFDTAAALLVVDTLSMVTSSLSTEALDNEQKLVIKNVISGIPKYSKSTKKAQSIRFVIGQSFVDLLKHIYGIVELLGRVFTECLNIIRNPKRFRTLEFLVALESTCVRSIPVVSLVVFLIGLVIAYIFAEQIRKYGASIFIVDGVTIAMTRELCPLIVATVMAGRSGSAFTAQLGSMKMNQEIDALQILGLTSTQLLVVPRVLALMIAMPLLVIIGNVVGIYGGMLISLVELDISYPMFLDRIQQSVPFRHFYLGLLKAPVFAIVIALIGCRMGLSVQNNTRSVGLHTTSTVVQSIVAVIILDAIFAVIYMKLGL